jgi:predicted TIM-barrel fold metal-dependent hydrolase
MLAMLLCNGQAWSQSRPIIDVHFHTDTGKFLPREYIAGELLELEPVSREEMIRESLAVMKQLNIVHAITSGPDPAIVRIWREVDPQRIIPALQVPSADIDQEYLDAVRDLISQGQIAVLGEVALQYEGIGASHPSYEPFFSVAAEFDIPIAVHLGPGPHDVFDVRPAYRVSDGDPLELEDVLNRHPGLRIYVMHAGWPFIENMIAIMHTYKNVYVDTAFINTALPEQELYYVLSRFVGAGLGDRIMFGSDPHPGAITLSIRTAYDRIESADFLSEEDKNKIFFGNASRFFHLTTGDRENAQH